MSGLVNGKQRKRLLERVTAELDFDTMYARNYDLTPNTWNIFLRLPHIDH